MQASCSSKMPQIVVDNWVQIFSDFRPQEALMLSLVSKAFESVTHQSRVWKIFVNTYKYDAHEYEQLCQIKMESFNNQSKIAFFPIKEEKNQIQCFLPISKNGLDRENF